MQLIPPPPTPLRTSPIRTVPLALLLCLMTAIAPAVRGESVEEVGWISLGMSTALSGPTAWLGINVRAGVVAHLEEVNRLGGIQGHRLSLIVLDDGYEPIRTVPNMHRLVDLERVLAVIGNVGTPTAVAAIPIAVSGGIPFLAAYSGAGVLRREPPERYVINYRASYAEEISAMVDALVEQGGLEISEIAFFTQRDVYGDAGIFGGLAALQRHGLQEGQRIANGRYERNTLAVEGALADILIHEPPVRAVIMVGAYAPCAAFIRLARSSGLEAIFMNVSFVGAETLAERLGAAGDGVVVTQVVPHPGSDLPAVRDCRAALAAMGIGPRLPHGMLEGYLGARMMVRGLEAIQGPVTSEALVDSLEGLGEFDLGLGAPLSLGPEEHQASHRVWCTVLREGRVEPFEWADLRSMVPQRGR